MSSIASNLLELKAKIPPQVRLVAVSKTKTAAEISEAYKVGQRDFGENYVQELVAKFTQLPNDIVWHFIGHLQTNKVKTIAPFVDWIHGVESEKLLREINKEAVKNNRKIKCLLQVHISTEDSKFGFSKEEILSFCRTFRSENFPGIQLCGLMGMASFTDNMTQVKGEFRHLHQLFKQIQALPELSAAHFTEISMGMSGDWLLAVEEGSTMVRIGSAIFGKR